MKRIIALLACCLMLLSLTACNEDDGSGAVFKYDISANPKTLDPQMANDINSELIIRNVFMGLLTENADGSLSEGVAEDYIVSDDGLVYTFKLREDVFWRFGSDDYQQCTAQDFVYGFRRLFLPETAAPLASEYYCIKNSKPISYGIIPDLSLLGVEALGDFELKITLDAPNPRFPSLLTKAPAMPCNEEFFLNSQGKYGLNAECTPSNGAFYLRSWNYDPYTITDNNNLILRRNAENSASRKVYPQGLNFFIMEDGGFVEDFVGGTTSCIAVNDDDAALISGDFTVQEFRNKTVGLIFNRSFPLFRVDEFRSALASLADRDAIGAALANYTAAEAIVPHEVSMLDESYRGLAGDAMTPQYSTQRAQAQYNAALDRLDKDLFARARIIAPDRSAAEAVSYLMQEWQREFGFYCIVETLGEEDYRRRLSEGSFEMAVIELTGSYNSPAAYLEHFRKNSTDNYGKYASADFERLMEEAATAADLSQSAAKYDEAEQLLIDSAAFVPLFYRNEYFFIGEDMTDIIYNPFSKTVDFSIAKKF